MRAIFGRPQSEPHRVHEAGTLFPTSYNMPDSGNQYISLEGSNQQGCFANIMSHPRERKMFLVIIVLSVAVAALLTSTIYYAKHTCPDNPVIPTTVAPPTTTHVPSTHKTTTTPRPTPTTTPITTIQPPTSSTPQPTSLPTRRTTTTTPTPTAQPSTSSTPRPTIQPTNPTQPRSTKRPTRTTTTSTSSIAPPTSAHSPTQTTSPRSSSMNTNSQDSDFWYPGSTTETPTKKPKHLKGSKKSSTDPVYYFD
uniref:Uncharacterized protein n=1 Tax=Graphocephala atropunctata TaxID=36148 RepID=A0A1B6MNS2_9HEMI